MLYPNIWVNEISHIFGKIQWVIHFYPKLLGILKMGKVYSTLCEWVNAINQLLGVK